MIYLASPYSHPDPAVREARFDAACRACVDLIAKGHVVYSPIVSSHPLVRHGVRTDWRAWERFDREVISRCDSLRVLELDGWLDSVGVLAEIEIARELGKPVDYMEPVP